MMHIFIWSFGPVQAAWHARMFDTGFF